MKVLLFTGGLDSLMAWRRMGEPLCVYVHVAANPYADREMRTIEQLEDESDLRVQVLYGGQLEDPEPDGHVLHRNLNLLATVAACTDARVLYLGGVRGESSPDKSKRFLRDAGRALSSSEHTRVRVEAPLRNRTKTANLIYHLEHWPEDRRLLGMTRSCYLPGPVNCGACLACLRRWVAFTNAGMPPEPHATAPPAGLLMPGVGEVWRYLRRTPVAEWLGMLDNHRDLRRALRAVA